MQDFQVYIDQIGGLAPLVVNAVKALVVLVLGWIAARVISGAVLKRALANRRIDATIATFAASLVKWAVLLVVLVMVLGLFGIEATSLVAMLGAVTLAIGLALQGTLSHLAAGFMLILFRPYKLGQYIDIDGTSGTVKEINLFFTELVTPQNVQVIVPNGQAWGQIITNFSHYEVRRLDLVFHIDYGDDADRAMQLILDVAKADERIHSEPAPWVRVTNLGDSSVDLTARLWTSGDDFWEVKFAVTKAIKEAFDAGGISIPFPHQVEIQKQA